MGVEVSCQHGQKHNDIIFDVIFSDELLFGSFLPILPVIHTHTHCPHLNVVSNWGIPSPDGIPLRGCRLFFFFFSGFFRRHFWRFSGPHRGKETPDLGGILQKHAY